MSVGSARLDSRQIAAAITEWGFAQSAAMRRESRGGLDSQLFDIRGRTWAGFECYFQSVPQLLAELEQKISAEEIGRLMRRPGSRPYYLQLFILMSNYLCAREQRIFVTGRPPEAGDREQEMELEQLVGFFVRAASAYRSDGRPTPSAPGFDQRILDDSWVTRCAELLAAPEELGEIQRAVGHVSLYNFLLHGEQRDGNFDHGPYDLGDGRKLLLRELNDLDNAFLPWADHEAPLSVSNICIGYAVRGVQMSFSIFGGCLTDPPDFAARVEAMAVFTVEGDELRPLAREELEALSACALELQGELFERVVGWPEIERSRYGTWLYANHLLPFLRLGGAEDLVERMVAEFGPIGETATVDFVSRSKPPEVFQDHAQLDDGSMFSPFAGAGH